MPLRDLEGIEHVARLAVRAGVGTGRFPDEVGEPIAVDVDLRAGEDHGVFHWTCLERATRRCRRSLLVSSFAVRAPRMPTRIGRTILASRDAHVAAARARPTSRGCLEDGTVRSLGDDGVAA